MWPEWNCSSLRCSLTCYTRYQNWDMPITIPTCWHWQTGSFAIAISLLSRPYSFFYLLINNFFSFFFSVSLCQSFSSWSANWLLFFCAIYRLDFNGYYSDKMLHFSLKTNQTDDDDTISGWTWFCLLFTVPIANDFWKKKGKKKEVLDDRWRWYDFWLNLLLPLVYCSNSNANNLIINQFNNFQCEWFFGEKEKKRRHYFHFILTYWSKKESRQYLP